jgi:hypothetical protein
VADFGFSGVEPWGSAICNRKLCVILHVAHVLHSGAILCSVK